MSQKRQATQRNPPQKKGGNRQNNSSNSKQSKGPVKNRPSRPMNNSPAVGAFVATARRQKTSEPKITASAKSCRVIHRELLASIVGSADFTVLMTLALNPGIAATFPWLSGIAQNWEKYRFNKLRFCYYPRTGTATAGSFMMAPDYDAADQPPISEQIASAYQDAVEDAPWKENICDLRSERLNERGMHKFVRTAALADNLDIKTYDGGNMQIIAIDGAAVAWGKLWVEYDVEFQIPQIVPTGTSLVSGGSVFSGGLLSGANPLGTVPNVVADSVGLSAVNSVVSFARVGTYLMTFDVVGTLLIELTATAGAGVTGTSLGQIINSTGTEIVEQYSIVVSIANSVVTMTASAATVTSAILRIASGPAGSY